MRAAATSARPWRAIAVLAATLGLASCQRPPDAALAARPNVVVVLVDDARWDDFGFAGHPFDFMRRSQGQPFLVFLAHKALHPNVMQRDDGSTAQVTGQREGFIPADRHRGRYAQAIVPRRPNALVAPKRQPALERVIPGLPPLSPATGTPDEDVRARLEMLLAVDDSLSRIRQTLSDMGQLDETLIIFTSDHGADLAGPQRRSHPGRRRGPAGDGRVSRPRAARPSSLRRSPAGGGWSCT